MARNKYKQKKNNREVKRYKNSLGENREGLESTYIQDLSMLNGSDSFASSRNKITSSEIKEPVEKKSLSLVIEDWAKENIIGILITAILIPLLGWLIMNTIDIQKSNAVSEYRIEKMEEKLDSLSEEIPNEDNLCLEINNLKEDVNKLNTTDLEKRIDRLEVIIENMK